VRRSSVLTVLVLFAAAPLAAQQNPSPDHPDHQAGAPPTSVAPQTTGWSIAVDGVLFATLDKQGGRRGETQFRSQNWLMAAGSHQLGPGSFSATAMVSAEPLTAYGKGYAQIFQVGEAYEGLQITDHQHPHDLFMQLSAAWSVPLGDRTRLTFAGGPVGEPALGPVPFMHRASSAENPTAPIAHHIFDSTHIANGVILGRIDRGIASVEGSVFRGRESDDVRYDLDVGALDSWSIRGWVRPTSSWSIQASYGFLEEPEALEPGDQRRSSASASWSRHRPSGFTAVTAAVGRNRRQYSTVDSVLLEGTHKAGRWSVYGRFERTDVETEVLLFPNTVHVPHPGELVDTVRAFTVGSVRDVATIRGLALGLGGDVTFYGVPEILQNTHDARPVSFHVFLRIARSDLGRRMWDMTMAQHGSAGHQHR
jgi:hypothetical protein